MYSAWQQTVAYKLGRQIYPSVRPRVPSLPTSRSRGSSSSGGSSSGSGGGDSGTVAASGSTASRQLVLLLTVCATRASDSTLCSVCLRCTGELEPIVAGAAGGALRRDRELMTRQL